MGIIHVLKVITINNIIITDFITLLSVYLLESLHPFQIVGWITLCQGREHRPIA
jgi:hypothetical protein